MEEIGYQENQEKIPIFRYEISNKKPQNQDEIGNIYAKLLIQLN